MVFSCSGDSSYSVLFSVILGREHLNCLVFLVFVVFPRFFLPCVFRQRPLRPPPCFLSTLRFLPCVFFFSPRCFLHPKGPSRNVGGFFVLRRLAPEIFVVFSLKAFWGGSTAFVSCGLVFSRFLFVCLRQRPIASAALLS